MTPAAPTRDALADQYLAQLPYTPYPVQEEALLAWFTADQGVLVCAPTGMGKTLIAHAALFEALHTGKVAYYTTPLIALTEQKFHGAVGPFPGGTDLHIVPVRRPAPSPGGYAKAHPARVAVPTAGQGQENPQVS